MKKKAFFAGVKAGLPVLFGFIPVGIAYAIMARQAGLTQAQTIMMSVSVFAGASQIMAVGMYAEGAGLITMITATLLLNLRHLIMSTYVHSCIESASVFGRLISSFGVTDESFSIFSSVKKENRTLPFYLGLVSITYALWVGGTAIGVFFAGFMPETLTLSFGIALYAMFIGLLFPSVKGNRSLMLLIAITALCNTVLNIFLPFDRSMIITTLVCSLLGVFIVDENPKQKKSPDKEQIK